MTPSLYIQILIVGIIGALLHSLFKIRSIQTKSRKANVAFSAIDYWKDDYVSHFISLLTIIMSMFFVADVLHLKPDVMYYLKFAFAFVGYAGNDIASRLFGVVNKRVNEIIDRKTTIADEAQGNSEPTPNK